MLLLNYEIGNNEYEISNQKQTNWPYKQYYVKTSRYSYRKRYHLFFQVQEKLETCRNSNLTNCRRKCFGYDIRYKCSIYIVTTNALNFKQLYIFYKFYLIKRKCIYLKEFHCSKMKFSIKDFFSKCDQIRRKLPIWSHLPNKSLMENFILCAMYYI